MSSPRRAVFRCDAAVTLGGGHVRRCLTLAAALRQRGWEVVFAVDRQTLPLFPRLRAWSDFLVVVDGTAEEEATRIGERLAHCDVVVVDHYRRDAHFERACRSFADRIVVIDDLADRPHDADLLIDPTWGRSLDAYSALAAPFTRVLTGPHYAPVRSAFAGLRASSLRHRTDKMAVRRILIAFGSIDADNLTGRALAAVASSCPDVRVDVVLGAGAPHLDAVRRHAAAIGDWVRLWVDTDHMAELMAAADIAIGAGGTTSWERCCLGLPAIVLVAADNQKANAESLSAAGAAVVLDTRSNGMNDLATVLRDLSGHPEQVRKMSRAAALLCDGRGTERLLMQLEPEMTHERTAVVLRPAVDVDRELMLAWQAHPSTRRFAFTQRVPTRAEHNRWFAARLSDPGCLLNIIVAAGVPVGVLRLDQPHMPDVVDCYEVSIYLSPFCYGLGFATAGLTLARRLVPEATLIARIRPENTASLAAFRRAAYIPRGELSVNVPADVRRNPLVAASRQANPERVGALGR